MRSLLRSQHLLSQWRQSCVRSLPVLISGEQPYTGAVALQQSEISGQRNQSAASWGYAAAGALIAGAAGGHVAHAEEAKAHVTISEAYAQPTELRGLPQNIILYQYEVCPFCCKLKAFLDFHKIPYRTVEVSPLTKKQLKWADYKKVPVAVLDGEAYGDSTAIITRLAAELKAAERSQDTAQHGRSSSSFWPFGSRKKSTNSDMASTAVSEDEEQWRRWVDDRLVRLLTVNIYRTAGESWQTFKYITDSSCNFGFLEAEAARVVGASMMYGISGRLRKKYDITGDVREELYKAADSWTDAVGTSRFHGGDEPDLADIAVFGVIRSVTCTDTFMDLMHNSRISDWYEQMMKAVGDSSRLSAS
ncbi:hypothetical protein CVIRNUC_003042 [Coccomyxa viridis]|uniref:Prostaglandin E synthase 2 n=1 Tax=Coccomyxa viridis TaxID=1274662 RepID=A0AAV1HYK6_9CHLO|nr:hypothetical protein CVIRNUC_003042 [Coccomyxa viridis]